MQLKQDMKLANEQAKFKKKFKFCGHTLTFYHFEKDKKICSWCGHYNYRNEIREFMKDNDMKHLTTCLMYVRRENNE